MQDRVDKRVQVLFLSHEVDARADGIDAHLLLICVHTGSQARGRKQHMQNHATLHSRAYRELCKVAWFCMCCLSRAPCIVEAMHVAYKTRQDKHLLSLDTRKHPIQKD